MPLALTAVFHKVPEGYIGFVEELPGANVQEPTLDEARKALDEAVLLAIAANRELAREGAELPGSIRGARAVTHAARSATS